SGSATTEADASLSSSSVSSTSDVGGGRCCGARMTYFVGTNCEPSAVGAFPPMLASLTATSLAEPTTATRRGGRGVTSLAAAAACCRCAAPDPRLPPAAGDAAAAISKQGAGAQSVWCALMTVVVTGGPAGRRPRRVGRTECTVLCRPK